VFDPFGFAWLGLLEGALLRIKQSSGSHTRVVGFPHVIAGKIFFFWKLREEGGRVLPPPGLAPYGSTGVLEKNFQKFWKIRNLSGTDAATVR
jgi:hypothetical protein